MTSSFYIRDNEDVENNKPKIAKSLFAKGDYSGALKIYLDIASASFSHKIFCEIGKCYYKLKNFDDAKVNFEHSISLEPARNISYLYLGNIYSLQNKTELAIENWITFFSFKPEESSVSLNLARAYLNKNMKFLSDLFFEKYLKYAPQKDSELYIEIQQTFENSNFLAKEFYQKSLQALSANDKYTAIKSLTYSLENNPRFYDSNFLLGKLYYEQKNYMPAIIYLKQAHCIDKKSLDTLELLTTSLIELGDFTSAYCCLKRIIPLVINNQKEYLEIIKAIKSLETSIDSISANSHLEWAQNYYDDNNYNLALFEYENCLILDNKLSKDLTPQVEKLRRMLNPEKYIIEACFEKGGYAYSNGEYTQSNKYFSKIMKLTATHTSEYKMAKSRLVNV